MGCSESKADSGASSGNKPDQKQPEKPDSNGQQQQQDAGEGNQQQQQATDDSNVYITTEEAVQYIVKELGVSYERASKMVDKFNKNDDNNVANKDLIAFCETVGKRKEEIRHKFQEIDTDGNGYVTADEANVLVGQLTKGVPESTVNAIVLRFDTEADGKIKYEAFIDFYSHIVVMQDNLEERYNLLGVDSDGNLDAEQLREEIINATGINPKYADCIVEDFDMNSDGKISKAEFIEMWMKLVGSA